MTFKLIRTQNNLENVYKTICENISDSIFIVLGLDFFKSLVINKNIYIYCIKNKKKISAIITVIDYRNYKFINKIVIKHLLLNPIKLILNFFNLFKTGKKSSNIKIDRAHLHLLHLVIFKQDFKKISLKKKDLLFDIFFKKILKNHKSKVLFLCFNNKNTKAKNYYRRNRFKKFHKVENILYFKKEFNI